MFKDVYLSMRTSYHDTYMLECLSTIIDERIRDGITDNTYYTAKMLSESISIIDAVTKAVKEKIEAMYKYLMELLDAYVLNEGYYLSKYIDNIKAYDQKEMAKIRFYSYEYRDLKLLPVKLKAIFDGETLIKSGHSYQSIKDDLDSQFIEDINHLLDERYTILEDRDKIVNKYLSRIQGEQIVTNYSTKKLEECLYIIDNIKKIKKDLREEKESMLNLISLISKKIKETGDANVDKLREVRSIGKYYGSDVDVTNMQNNYEGYLLVNKYYTELSLLIESLYSTKIRVYNEMYSNYKQFVNRCITQAGVVQIMQKNIEIKIDRENALIPDVLKKRT